MLAAPGRVAARGGARYVPPSSPTERSMPLSRRGFVRSLGLGSAGALALPLVTARLDGAAPYPGLRHGRPPSPLLRLDRNENPNGPGPEAIAAIQATLRETCRYPVALDQELVETIAAAHGVKPENVWLGCGSTELLRVALDAFAAAGAGLVTAAPSFENPATYAAARGVPVTAVPVDAELRLDLDAMAAKANGAGLVYLCNPNNPTATAHGAADVREFVSRVLASSPRTAILIDEAYYEYVDDPSYATAIPLALADPRVLVLRTFSKVHGLAGLRAGYAIGRSEAIRAMAPYGLPVNVNVLAAAAARASLGAPAHVERERVLNRDARRFTGEFFQRAGFR